MLSFLEYLTERDVGVVARNLERSKSIKKDSDIAAVLFVQINQYINKIHDASFKAKANTFLKVLDKNI